MIHGKRCTKLLQSILQSKRQVTVSSINSCNNAYSSSNNNQKTYAGLTKEQVEAKLKEQGIFPGSKKKVKMSKWVNPILHKPIDSELYKPHLLGTDQKRKLDMAVKILARPFIEEQKRDDYRNILQKQKLKPIQSDNSSDIKKAHFEKQQIQQSIEQIQQLKHRRLKKEKEAFQSDRDSSIFVNLYPAKLVPDNIQEATEFQKQLINNLIEIGKNQLSDPEFSQKYKYPLVLKGWKVAATQPKTQLTLGLDRPFIGPIFEHQVFKCDSSSPISLKSTRIGQLAPCAECELVFVLNKTLTARTEKDEPYTREQVAECVGEVIPAIELIGSRIEDIASGSDSKNEILMRIADCGEHIALLLASNSIVNPSFHDLDQLYLTQVQFTMNEDEEVIHGQGNYVYNGQVHRGDIVGPLDTTAWTINEITAPLSQGGRGMDVAAGTLISSGTMTGKSRHIDHGDKIVARFRRLPTLSDHVSIHVSAEF